MFERLKNIFTKKTAFIQGNLSDITGRWASSAYKYNYTYNEFIFIAQHAYNANPDLQEACHKISTYCLKLPICVNNPSGQLNGNLPKGAMDFLHSPSPSMNWKQFVESSLIQYFVGGEVNYLDLAEVNENPQLLLVYPNELKKVEYVEGIPFSYDVASAFFQRYKLQKFLQENRNCIFENEYKKGMIYNRFSHFFNHNPTFHQRGMSIVVSMLNDIEILVKGRTWNRAVLENEGRPSGVFYYPPNAKGARSSSGTMGSNSVDEEIRQNFAGSQNAGKSLLLKGGLQFQSVMHNMKDIDFINGLKFSRSTIANRLGIPLPLFGSEENSTYNNLSEAKYTFYLDTCVPLMNKWLEFISTRILQPKGILNIGETLCVDLDKTDIANTRRIEKMKELSSVTHLTPNEKRDLCGYKPIKEMNADTLLIPKANVPIEELGIDTEQDFGGEDEDKKKDDDSD